MAGEDGISTPALRPATQKSDGKDKLRCGLHGKRNASASLRFTKRDVGFLVPNDRSDDGKDDDTCREQVITVEYTKVFGDTPKYQENIPAPKQCPGQVDDSRLEVCRGLLFSPALKGDGESECDEGPERKHHGDVHILDAVLGDFAKLAQAKEGSQSNLKQGQCDLLEHGVSLIVSKNN